MDAIDPLVLGVGGAIVAGLAGSLHCALMCGPLACAALPRGEEGSAAPSAPGLVALRAPARHGRVALAYHAARIAAYTAIGAALGLVGAGLSATLKLSLAPALPWLLAAVLVGSALGLGKRVGRIPGLSRLSAAIARAGARLSPAVRAGAIGALTPLLPCGLLYGLFAGAVAAGSPAGGAVVLGGFAVGATPALVAAQLGAPALARLRGVPPLLGRRGGPRVAAAGLVFRALATSGGGSCH